MIARTDMISSVHPKQIFIMAGINDLKHYDVSKFSDKYTTLITKINKENPTSRIYIQSILPILNGDNKKINDFNNALKKIASEKNITYINIHDYYLFDGKLNPNYTKDGVHLKPEAYKYWETELEKYIQ